MSKLPSVDRNMHRAAYIMSLAYCETTTALSIHNSQLIPRVMPQCLVGFFLKLSKITLYILLQYFLLQHKHNNRKNPSLASCSSSERKQKRDTSAEVRSSASFEF